MAQFSSLQPKNKIAKLPAIKHKIKLIATYPAKIAAISLSLEIALASRKSISLLSKNLAIFRQTKIAIPITKKILVLPAKREIAAFFSSIKLTPPKNTAKNRDKINADIKPTNSLLRNEFRNIYFAITFI